MEQLPERFRLRFTSGLRTQPGFEGDVRLQYAGPLTDIDLRNEYRNADVVLFPTRYEGFGYVAAEGLACGTPVVASRCSSIPEIVTDGECGTLCAVDDVAAFAAAIQFLEENPQRLSEMSHAGIARIVNLYNVERMTSAYETLIKELV